jgi:hypothetical protein
MSGFRYTVGITFDREGVAGLPERSAVHSENDGIDVALCTAPKVTLSALPVFGFLRVSRLFFACRGHQVRLQSHDPAA